MSVRHRLIAAAAVGALLLSGCSGAKTGVTAASTSQVLPAADASTSDVTTGSSSSRAAAGGVPTAASSKAGAADSNERADAVECLSAAGAMSAVSNGFLPVLQERSGPEAFDPTSVINGLATALPNAPAVIQPDIDKISAAAVSLKGKTLDDATKVFNSPDVAAATAHLEAWTSDHC